MSTVEPFTIDIPQGKIDKLRQKLSLAEFPDELEDAGWDLGCPLAELQRLTLAWAEWDWREAETRLNQYPHFHTGIEVDGFGNLDIHFVHQKSEVDGAIPLLFVHGWPGSFVEVLKIAPHLTSRSNPSFHVVAPSLPNFGFSQGVSKRGFAVAQYAETCHKLMLKLGYSEYVTQAGDWGFWITRTVGKLYPESCKASHFNMVYAKAPGDVVNSQRTQEDELPLYSEQEKKGMEKRAQFRQEGRGYNIIQSTKPQTVTYALQDSPIALLGWIYEKLHDWADQYAWTDDEIFTWISIYQFSRAGPGAPHRIYYETMHSSSNKDGRKNFTYDDLQAYTPNVKHGLTYNPGELENVPKSWGRTLGDVVYEAENERGGHFYAYEFPELLVRDLRAMFGKGGGAYEVVTGKDGYQKP